MLLKHGVCRAVRVMDEDRQRLQVPADGGGGRATGGVRLGRKPHQRCGPREASCRAAGWMNDAFLPLGEGLQTGCMASSCPTLTVAQQPSLRRGCAVRAGPLFSGRQRFRLRATPDGKTAFEHSEAFTGPLIPLLACLGMFRSIAPQYARMNEALKMRVESLSASESAQRSIQ